MFPMQATENVNLSTNPQEKCVKPYSDHRTWGMGNALELMEHGGDPVMESLLELAKPTWFMGTEGGLASEAQL